MKFKNEWTEVIVELNEGLNYFREVASDDCLRRAIRKKKNIWKEENLNNFLFNFFQNFFCIINWGFLKFVADYLEIIYELELKCNSK